MRTLVLCLSAVVLFAGKTSAQKNTQLSAPATAAASMEFSGKIPPPTNNMANMRIYPNPVTEYMILSFPYPTQLPMIADIYDASGKLAMTRLLEAGPIEYYIDMHGNANGHYVVRLKAADQQVSRRIVLLTR